MEYEEEDLLVSFVYRTAFEFGKEGNSVESLITFCREQNAMHLFDNAIGFWNDGVFLYPENQSHNGTTAIRRVVCANTMAAAHS